MRWLAKAVVLKALSALPGGATAHRWAQKHLTRSLDPSPARVRQKIEVALLYLDTLQRLGTPADLASITHIDIGAGWHPTIPLFLHAAGCERQCLFDVAPLLDLDLLERTLSTVQVILTDPSHAAHARVKHPLTTTHPPSLPEALRQWGITYVAPCGGTLATMRESAEMITATQVLYHVPREDLRHLFADVFRALKPGGHFLAVVHLANVFRNAAGFRLASHTHFSPASWERWVNSRLSSFNRLKAPDYREMLEGAGFALPHFEVEPGSADDLAKLDLANVHSSFARYSREDLVAKHLFFVARKP